MASIEKDEKDKKIFDTYFPDYDTMGVRNKQPGFKYRWIRSRDRDVARAESKGWEMVRGGPERSVLTPSNGMVRKGTDVDSTITNGDLVLMRMPESLFKEVFEKPNLERIAMQTGAVTSPLKQAAGALMFEGGSDLPNRMNQAQYEEMLKQEAKKG